MAGGERRELDLNSNSERTRASESRVAWIRHEARFRRVSFDLWRVRHVLISEKAATITTLIACQLDSPTNTRSLRLVTLEPLDTLGDFLNDSLHAVERCAVRNDSDERNGIESRANWSFFRTFTRYP